jgi:hypothetical protein
MSMRSFILLFFLLFSLNSYAYKYYLGFGFSPMINLNGNNTYFLQTEWSPRENVGSRFYIGGGPNSATLGAALLIKWSTSSNFSQIFKIGFGMSVPFLINFNSDFSEILLGVSFFNTISFRLDRESFTYLYINPFEFKFLPFAWRVNSKIYYNHSLYYMPSIGVRVAI